MRPVVRYHPALVVLHWMSALLIIGALTISAVVLAHLPNDAPKKLEGLRSHMIGAGLILALMSARLVVRNRTRRPDDAPTGHPSLDRLAWLSHRAFYVLVFAQIATGLVMALQARLPQILFLHAPGALPPSFWVYPTRPLHYVISRLLMGLIVLHVAAVGYHHVVRRDRLLSRMSFGPRTLPHPAGPSLSSKERPMSALDLFARMVLIAGGLLLAVIGLRTIADPVRTAEAAGLALRTPGAIDVFLSTGGGFPLGAALFALACAISRRTLGPGLALLAVLVSATLAVRVGAVAQFGGFAAQKGPLIGETVISLMAVTVLSLRLRKTRAAA